MATPESQVEKDRYFRKPKVVFVSKVDDDHFLVSDKEGMNGYTISKELLDRDYEVLY